jgi:FkbM family methyltransferase
MKSILVPALALVVFAGGCTDDSPQESATPDSITDVVGAVIKKRRAYIKSLPNRTGILAEDWKYSVFAEEIIIRDFFQDRRGGVFLDVGCAWPVTGSNTYYLEKHLGWTGIGIDALDDFRAGWEEKRPLSKFRNFLVTDKIAGPATFYKSEGLGLSSTSRDHAMGKMFGVEVEPEKIEVRTTTLDALLDREGVTKIDLVSMDIEGHEAKALAGFDLDRFAPELLVIEGKSRQVKKFMNRHGYVQIQRYVRYDNLNRYFERKKAGDPPEM